MTEPATAPASADGGEVPHRMLITISIMFAAICQALDGTIANVALPRIQGSLSATQDQMIWVLTSYIVAAAIMTPLSGWLAGQVGRKRVFLYSITGFTVSSALCGLSQTLPEIVIARLLQGMCGAALVPMSQACLLDINPPARHARAMSLWIMGVMVGPILGPVLGGWLTENYNWRWVFFINVPIGILSFVGISSFMSETKIRRSSFDFFGFSMLSLAVGALQLMLDRGQLMDWFNSAEIWVEAMTAGIALYLFIVHMLTTDREPFVSPALFKDRNFMTGNLFVFIMGLVMFATLALVPTLLQELFNYPVILTGLITASRGLGTFLAIFVVSRMMGKIDTRIVIGSGFALTALSLWQMTGFYLQIDTSPVIWSGLIQGVGVGFVFLPLATIAFATLSPQLRNEGTAFFSLMRNIGSSIGISAVSTLLTRNSQIMHARLAERITPFGDSFNPLKSSVGFSAHGLAAVNESVSAQGLMIAYNNDFKVILVLVVCSLPLVALFSSSSQQKADPAMAAE
jgi:DHA2 family multidrug resistance protein